MTDQDFKEHVLNFIEKTEEWKQQVSRELGWIRGKLERKEEPHLPWCGKISAAFIALILSLK